MIFPAWLLVVINFFIYFAYSYNVWRFVLPNMANEFSFTELSDTIETLKCRKVELQSEILHLLPFISVGFEANSAILSKQLLEKQARFKRLMRKLECVEKSLQRNQFYDHYFQHGRGGTSILEVVTENSG